MYEEFMQKKKVINLTKGIPINVQNQLIGKELMFYFIIKNKNA